MRRILFIMSLLCALLLTGCNMNESIHTSNLIENTTDEQISGSTLNNLDDEQLLSDFKSKVKVVENRKDFYDDSGELLYFIQHDYLESNTDDERINKIVSNYPKTEINENEDPEITRMFPEEVYYDTSTYEIASVHNGILNIHQLNDWWWGSPHPYPSFRCQNYVLETGEVYDFPIEIKENIYDKVTEKLIEIAQKNNYEGLIGDYYDKDNNRVVYLNYDETTEQNTLIDKEALKKYIIQLLEEGCFEIKDDKIVFYIESAYSLSNWASRTLYSTIDISNEWNI